MTERAKPDSRRGDHAVGKRIAARRKELEWDRKRLAEEAGVSYPYISQLETGYRNASYRQQVAIATALGVSLDELFAPEELRDQVQVSAVTPEVSAPNRSALSTAVARAVAEIESLPSAVRLDALNQIQLSIVRGLTSTRLIERLEPNEVFVFGSNKDGVHDGGAARQAYEKFGAEWGEGHGHHGQSYAIDTMSDFPTLAEEVQTFLGYARRHSQLRFLVTPIGTGVAGYRVGQVAPLFADAPENVRLPAEFVAVLKDLEQRKGREGEA